MVPSLARPNAGLLLAVLVAAALALRLVGLDHGLPHLLEPDAEVAMQVEYLRGARGGARREASLATYPTLIAHVATIALDAPPREGERGARTLGEHLALASAHVLDARRVVALLSILVVPGTYLLARSFVPSGWALAAAGCAAFSLLGVDFAQQARPHAAAAAFYPWAVAAAIALRRRGDTAAYAAAGLTAALAIGCLHSAVSLALPIAAAHLLRERRRALDPRALIPLALAGLSIAVFYRHVLAGARDATAEPDGSQVASGWHVVETGQFDGAGFAAIARTLWWYEPALLALTVAALVVWARRRIAARARAAAPARDASVVLSFALPYALVIGVYGGTYERFLLPLIPFLAVLGVWGARELASAPAGRWIATGALALALALPAAASARLAWLRARPDTLEEAAVWVRAHVEPERGRVLLSPLPYFEHRDSSIDLPLARGVEACAGPGGPRARYYDAWSTYLARVGCAALPEPRFAIEWLVWSPGKDAAAPDVERSLDELLADPRELLAYSGPGIYVIEDFRNRPAYFVAQRALQRALEARGERLARIAPDATGLGLKYQDDPGDRGPGEHFTLRCLSARAVGPVIEIWRVDPEDAAR